jgi:hypothetical protein
LYNDNLYDILILCSHIRPYVCGVTDNFVTLIKSLVFVNTVLKALFLIYTVKYKHISVPYYNKSFAHAVIRISKKSSTLDYKLLSLARYEKSL